MNPVPSYFRLVQSADVYVPVRTMVSVWTCAQERVIIAYVLNTIQEITVSNQVTCHCNIIRSLLE